MSSSVDQQAPRRLSDPRAFGGALLLYGLFYLGFFAKSLASGLEIAPGDALDFGLATFLSPTTVWTDAMYSGYPIIADPQALAWYPVFQLMRALGLSWSLFEISGYVLASATGFLLVRRLTGSTVAGILSGAVFGFSGIMLAHINHFNQVHAAAWLPLVVYGLLLVRNDQGRDGALVGAMGFGLMWAAGHPQVVVYTVYLSAAVVAGWLWIDRPPFPVVRQRALWWAVAGGLGIALAAVLILPAAELGGLSRRAEPDWNLYISRSMPPWQVLTLAFPLAFGGFASRTGALVDYVGVASLVEMAGYVGLLPLALALAAAVERRWPQRREARLWVGIAVVAVLLCLGPATPIGTLFFYAPGYASFRVPARHLFVVAFCVSVASGIGLAHLMRNPKGAWSVAVALVATCAAAVLGMAAFSASGDPAWARLSENPAYLRWAVGMPLLIGGMLLLSVVAGARLMSRGILSPAAVGLLLLIVHLGDMLAVHDMLPGYHFGYAHVGPADWTLRPEMAELREELRESGGRALAADGSHNPLLRPNLTRSWKVPVAGGSGSLAIERYADMLGMGGPGDVYPETLSDAQPGVDLFAIQYVLVPSDLPVVEDLRRQAGRWQEIKALKFGYLLFRNTRARPRAWCVPEVVRTEETLDVMRSGLLPDGRVFDPARVALIDPGALPGWPLSSTPQARSRVVATRVPASEGQYDVDAAAGDCLLVLSEVHYPWWRVSIDGEEASPLRVNHAMVGVAVPEGHHVVRLWLAPRSLWIGSAISGTALLAWTVLALFRTGRRRD